MNLILYGAHSLAIDFIDAASAAFEPEYTDAERLHASIADEEIKTELMKLNQALYEKFGYEMKYMRPPKGEFSERTLSITDSLGFKTVMWSFAYVDWNDDKQPSKEEAMKKIISNLHNGEIMLLHATSKTNSEIMGEMVDKIKEEGYEIKSLEEFR